MFCCWWQCTFMLNPQGKHIILSWFGGLSASVTTEGNILWSINVYLLIKIHVFMLYWTLIWISSDLNHVSVSADSTQPILYSKVSNASLLLTLFSSLSTLLAKKLATAFVNRMFSRWWNQDTLLKVKKLSEHSSRVASRPPKGEHPALRPCLDKLISEF